MNSLIYLTPSDFDIQMHHNISGLSIVLFYAPSCHHSMNILPIIKRLPKSMSGKGCQFGVLNVGYYKDIISKSQTSNTPLTYVPYIVMYNDGIPFIKYEGEPTEDGLISFILSVIDKRYNDIKKKTREYCEGQPLCGDDDVCYLIVDEKCQT